MSMQSRVDAVIDTAIAERRIVGAVVMVAHDGKHAYTRAAGFADREAGTPMAFDTIFRLASFTKPLVAAATLALLDKGLLALEDPVTEYLPWFTPALADGSRPEITISQLMTHTAGLETDPAKLEAHGVPGGLDDSEMTLEDYLHRLAEVPLAWAPGTHWAYSKGIDVMGGVIAAIEGRSLGEAVHKYVTGPLGMRDTSFLVTDPKRLAVPYGDAEPEPVRMGDRHRVPARDGNGQGTVFMPARNLNPRVFHAGGSGMSGSAPDFLKFLEALRRGGDPILKPELVNLGASNQIGAIAMDGRPGFGFGLFGAVVLDPKATGGKWGRGTYEWGGVYGHRWFVDPAAGISVVSLTNTAVEGVNGPFPSEIRDALYPAVDPA
jgi:CubicO group peptidase (beta-lactamase class C family)